MPKGDTGYNIRLAGAAKAPAVYSYATFFQKSYPIVLGFLVKTGINTALAEDAVQEAFITAYKRWSDVRRYKAPHSWVCTVALRLAPRSVRLQRLQLPLDYAMGTSQQEDPFQVEAVMSVLRRLPARQRECMALLMDGFTPLEISEVLRLPDATVRSNIRHARRNIIDQPDSISQLAEPINQP